MFGIKMERGSYSGIMQEEGRKELLKEKRAARAAAEETWQNRYDMQKKDAWDTYLCTDVGPTCVVESCIVLNPKRGWLAAVALNKNFCCM